MRKNSVLRKVLAVALSAVTVLGTGFTTIGQFVGTDISTCAAETLTYGDLKYVINDDNTIEITGNTCYGRENLTIPSSINGIPVTSIGKCAFCYADVSKVVIKEGISKICWGAFSNCTLSSIVIPDSISLIEDHAFYYCKNLESVNIPSSVKTINAYVFEFCDLLKTIEIPNNVTEIKEYAFAFCDNLESLTLSENLESIKYDAFSYCNKLTNVSIPSSVQSISSTAFYSCDNLLCIDVNGENQFYSSYDGVLFNKSKNKLVSYPSGKRGSYIIPSIVTSIDDSAFSGCKELTDITFSDSVSNLGICAFMDCTSLHSAILPNNMTLIPQATFAGCTSLSNVVIPNSVTSISAYAFRNCSSLQNVIIPDNVTFISESAFSDCTGFINITIPESVKHIDKYAFRNCSNLTSAIIPDSVKYIGENVFYGCDNLTVYGMKGNYSETYASKNNIPFAELTSYIEGVSPTCTENGKQGYYHNNFNGKDYEDIDCKEEIENLDSWIVIPATGHSYLQRAVSPTCTEQGYTTHICSVCGDSYIDEYIEPTGHDYSIEIVSIPTCTEKGDITYICSMCGDSYTVDIEPTGHSYDEEVIAPTTEEEGYTLHTCENCGESYKDNYTAKLLSNHSTLSAETIALGGKITVTATATGGTGEYLYQVVYKQKTQSKWTTVQTFNENSTVTFKPANATDYDVCVKVKDSSGKIVKKFFEVKVNAKLANTSTLSTENITLGQQITVNGFAQGGVGEYQYQVVYKQTSQSKWTTAQAFSENATVTFKPAKSTSYDVCVKVKDNNGTIVKKFFTVQVNAKLTNTSAVSATTIKKGDTVAVNGSATGGAGDYTYAVYYKQKAQTKWTTKQDFNDNADVSIKPAQATDYDICVKVKDKDGTIVKKYFTVTVTK